MVRLRKEAESVPVEESIERVATEEAKELPPVAETEAQKKLANWIPRTSLGREVMNREITSLSDVLKKGLVIREPQIVDALMPDMRDELIMTGGMPGKGGGKKRTGVRVTTRMHKSGRKRKLSAFIAIGNRNGIVGLGYASGADARTSIEKAMDQAKLSVISVRRGCGSWECACRQPHSIPFKVEGKTGSTRVRLIPAPRGLGVCANDEAKKMFRLAGIKDVWMKSEGETGTHLNFVRAIFDALQKLNKVKVTSSSMEAIGMCEGPVELSAAEVAERAAAMGREDRSRGERGGRRGGRGGGRWGGRGGGRGGR